MLWEYEKYRLMQRWSEIFALKAAKVIENHIKNVVRGENRGSKGISITGPCFLLICQFVRLFVCFQHWNIFNVAKEQNDAKGKVDQQ